MTSDSIAARIADLLDAQLTLLKSAPLPKKLEKSLAAGDWSALAAAGWVDGFFGELAENLREIRLICPLQPAPADFPRNA